MDTLILYGIAAVLFALSFLRDRRKTAAAALKGLKSVLGILPQLLAVVMIIALVLALFDPETISRFIGEKSGIPGTLAALAVGAVTLIPGFVAFPAAGELLRNGAGTLQIAAFVSSLMMVGVVTLPMEIAVFGRRSAVARNVLALAFSFAAAFFVAWAVGL